MKVALYNFFILCYSMAATIISPFNAKARKFVNGRKGLLRKIRADFSQNTHPIAWFHCASLGEFEQGKPVMESFKASNPEFKILVTFFSPSGYEQRKSYSGAEFIYYLPLDHPTNSRKFLSLVKPQIVFFIKYEFWYNYLNQIKEADIPLFNISGLFTPDHGFFKSNGLQRQMLSFFNHFFVQNQQSKDLLDGIGVKNVSVSGDTRFDRVIETLNNPERYPEIDQFKSDKLLMVIGSSWPEDMAVLYDFINQSDTNIKFLIAPHLVDSTSVKKLEEGLKVTFSKWTERRSDLTNDKVLIIDTIGMLSSLYQYGNFAYIGGAFRDGVHNILEAVAFGLPVVFGNKHLDKFPETLELIERGGAFSVANKGEVSDTLTRLQDDTRYRQTASDICKSYVSEKSGATKIILDHINQFL